MIESTKNELISHGITFANNNNPEVQLGFGRKKDIVFEPPIQLRSGKYDVDSIGAFTYIGGSSSTFRHISSIGRFCSIAGNITTGLVEHPTSFLSTHPFQYGEWHAQWKDVNDFVKRNNRTVTISKNRFSDIKSKKIVIGNDVWIGERVMIMRGVTVGDGAIIAAGALVSKDVEPYSIVGGVPAKVIKYRFSKDIIEKLCNLRWWDYGLSILDNVDFTNIEEAIESIESNISSGNFNPYEVKKVIAKANGNVEIYE